MQIITNSTKGKTVIAREIEKKIKQLSKKLPVIAVLGPRQSGKTTITKAIFKKHTYVSLEDFEFRQYAQSDPKGFLEKLHNQHGIILDEVQYVPHLLSYIQLYVDTHKKYGYFVITGSQNFLLNASITQTLAGRVSIFTLLPLSIQEMKKSKILEQKTEDAMFTGCYPRIYDEQISPQHWLPDYVSTYVERDVRQLKNITDLDLFQTFIKLCAGRIGQLVNLTSLSNDCGISISTTKAWISLLEQSYILFLLRPHFKNFSKRVVKSPKIYFYDTGLACSLLGITSSKQLSNHYLKGGLFESFVISDIMKQFYNNKMIPPLYFWRDKHGHEIDCIIEKADKLIPIEIKAGKTITNNYFTGLDYWNKLSGQNPADSIVIYAGDGGQKRSNGTVLSWKNITKLVTK